MLRGGPTCKCQQQTTAGVPVAFDQQGVFIMRPDYNPHPTPTLRTPHENNRPPPSLHVGVDWISPEPLLVVDLLFLLIPFFGSHTEGRGVRKLADVWKGRMSSGN